MTLPAHMSGALLTGHGGPEARRLSGHVSTPQPGPGEVLVQVLAAGVNLKDINTPMGRHGQHEHYTTDGSARVIPFPPFMGSDLCGRVVRQGAGVTEPKVGARVICRTDLSDSTAERPAAVRPSALAEFCVVPASYLLDVSDTVLTDMEVGAMPYAYGVAHNLVSRAGVRAGEKILVTGASAGVGLAAVQLARLRGARVTGQCGAEKAKAVLAAGAVATVGRDPDAKSYDVVIDAVGGPRWHKRLEALRPGGRYAVSGAIAGPMVDGDLRTVFLNDLTLFGCTHQSREVFSGLVTIINTGSVKPLVSKIYPLRDSAGAQVNLAAGPCSGKLLLVPNESNDNG